MLFNDLRFLYVFLPLTMLAVSLLCPARWRAAVLIFASLVFYGQSGREHAAVLVGCVLWVFIIVDRFVDPKGRKLILSLAILGPLGALAYFKYANFFLADILMLRDDGSEPAFDLFRNIVLPAGISFFTFQLIAYAIDRFRGDIPTPVGFTSLLLFISFFPQLVAGPIVRYRQVADALKGLAGFRLTSEKLVQAIGYFCVGLAFKVLVADSINHFIDPLVQNPEELGWAGLLAVVYSYTFQIYFDFYGYSLCAIGLGCLFGFNLPDNFLRPYSTLNPRDFWRCWHVSLSNFIRDYIYIPLGGNRRYIANILIVFVACGLWHGAGYSFIVWGVFHFGLVAGYKLVERPWNALPIAVQWILNFSLVSFGWLFFVFPMDKFLLAVGSHWTKGAGMTPSLDLILVSVMAALICFFVRAERIVHGLSSLSPVRSSAMGVGVGLVFIVTMLFIDRSATFIYFRF